MFGERDPLAYLESPNLTQSMNWAPVQNVDAFGLAGVGDPTEYTTESLQASFDFLEKRGLVPRGDDLDWYFSQPSLKDRRLRITRVQVTGGKGEHGTTYREALMGGISAWHYGRPAFTSGYVKLISLGNPPFEESDFGRRENTMWQRLRLCQAIRIYNGYLEKPEWRETLSSNSFSEIFWNLPSTERFDAVYKAVHYFASWFLLRTFEKFEIHNKIYRQDALSAIVSAVHLSAPNGATAVLELEQMRALISKYYSLKLLTPEEAQASGFHSISPQSALYVR